MRRKTKCMANTAMVFAGITGACDVLFQWKEHLDKGIPFTWKSYNGWRTLKYSGFAGLVGLGAGYLYYVGKTEEEAALPFNSDNYLRKLLTAERLKGDPVFLNKVLAYREKVKQLLVDKFGNKLAGLPEDTGSFYKRTAIASNYDLDIILPLAKTSYGTLAGMYENVYETIEKSFSNAARVTRHNSAVGLTFGSDDNPVHLDIVPGRETDDYAKDKNLKLYVNPEWFWQRGSSFKTNVGMQKTMLVNKPEARRVIKLLKIYRDRNDLPLPKLIAEQCVVEAMSYKNYGFHYSDTINLLNCMEYISLRLGQKKYVDFANSNNNLHDKLTDSERNYIADQLSSDVKRIEQNPHYIKEIFEC